MPAPNAVANISGFTVGQDLRRLLITPTNGGAIDSIQLGRLIEFTATPIIHEETVIPVNNGGIPLFRNIYSGWHGGMHFARFNGNMSQLMAYIMGQFNNEGLETTFGLQATVVNAIYGTTDEYNFQGCVFSNISVGDFTSVKQVNQPLSFRAQIMQVNGGTPSSPIA